MNLNLQSFFGFNELLFFQSLKLLKNYLTKDDLSDYSKLSQKSYASSLNFLKFRSWYNRIHARFFSIKACLSASMKIRFHISCSRSNFYSITLIGSCQYVLRF